MLGLAAACGSDGSTSERKPVAPSDAGLAPVVAIDASVPLSVTDALPAWRAVVERHRMLVRNDSHGVVVGRVGEAVDGASWLIDEANGNGVLAIRVTPPLTAPAGARAVVAGAWEYEKATKRWLWRRTGVTIDKSAEAIEHPYPPGHTVGPPEELPEGARLASTAARRKPMSFAVVGAPVKVGDGWAIADERGGQHVAWLVLPGERATYGGQEMLADDETWKLRVGSRYVVDVIRMSRPKGALPVYTASGPPRHLAK